MALLVVPATVVAQAVRGRLAFDLGPTYNRVEGVPVRIGPIIETVETNPIRVEVGVIIRPEPDLAINVDRVGFRARVAKFLGGERRFRVGVAGWAEVQSIEDRGLSNLETGLATFLFHDDRRDYYEAIGGGVFAIATPPNLPILAGLQFQVEDHEPNPPGSPESVFRQDRPWRSQPLAADGLLYSLAAAVHIDTRPTTPDGPFNGWWIQTELDQGLGGTLENLPIEDATGNPIAGVPEPDTKLTVGSIDVRRYNAVGDLGFNFRALFRGSVTGDPLPPEFQSAPGGTGTLPGYDLLAADCGSRSTTVTAPLRFTTIEFYPLYGCNRYLLLQAQAVGYFGFRLGRDRSDNPWEAAGFNFELIPQWAVFLDAARGWAASEYALFGARDEDWLYDVGGGILLGDLGFFAAYPLTGDDKEFNFVVRIGQRF